MRCDGPFAQFSLIENLGGTRVAMTLAGLLQNTMKVQWQPRLTTRHPLTQLASLFFSSAAYWFRRRAHRCLTSLVEVHNSGFSSTRIPLSKIATVLYFKSDGEWPRDTRLCGVIGGGIGTTIGDGH